MKTPRWSGEPCLAAPRLPTPVWFPGPPGELWLLGPSICLPLHPRSPAARRRGNDYLMVPCVMGDCRFCSANHVQVEYHFYPAKLHRQPCDQRDKTDRETWKTVVLMLDDRGHGDVVRLGLGKGFIRGMIVGVSRKNGRAPMQVHFHDDRRKDLHADGFDVRPILERGWRRWLVEPPAGQGGGEDAVILPLPSNRLLAAEGGQ
jgi:hypothetical protein